MPGSASARLAVAKITEKKLKGKALGAALNTALNKQASVAETKEKLGKRR